MSGETKTQMLTVQLKGTLRGYEVTVIEQISHDELKSALSSLIKEMAEAGVGNVPCAEPIPAEGQAPPLPVEESPYQRLARELDSSSDDVRKILGIKGDSVQVYRASRLKIADAICLICFAYEKGLGRQRMPYDELMKLLETSQIKTKTPGPVLCFNMIRQGYFQKRAYEEGRNIVLESKGEKKAREVAKQLLVGSCRGEAM